MAATKLDNAHTEVVLTQLSWGRAGMGWLDWFRRANSNESKRTEEWRRVWRAALDAPDAASAKDLRARLTAIGIESASGIDDEQFEIEREMLEGLEALVELSHAVALNGPPTIATGHRAVGPDRCHFSAPASLPDDPAQPSGTLLLTSTRAVFIGGGRAVTIPWHLVGECSQHDRDVLLVRVDRQDLHRVRCNTFTDTLCAAFLARHLARRRV
jgi:hypothetical protein